MLKKLRRKIILLNLTLVGAVLLITTLIISISSANAASANLIRTLRYEANSVWRDEDPDWIAQQGEQTELHVSFPYLIARLDSDGSWYIERFDLERIDDAAVQQILDQILQTNEEEGFLLSMQLAYVHRQYHSGTVVALGDTNHVRTAVNNSLLLGLIVFLTGMAICCGISVYLSGVAVRPIEEAWRQQKQFIADASHELKTPLTVILANHDIIASHGNETVAQQAKWLNATAEEAENMRLLIEEMLTLAKTEDEQIVPQLQPAEISPLIEEEVLFLEPLAYEAHVPLEAHIQKGLVLNTDPHMLRKLTAILVDNAVKHGLAGSPVTITLTGSKPTQLSVHNFGLPIPPEDLPHVFDRFYRSDKSRSTEGHGLGLAIAQAMAQKLHGTLTVTSSEQTGTTFTVTFP